jgi:hypothetical protein
MSHDEQWDHLIVRFSRQEKNPLSTEEYVVFPMKLALGLCVNVFDGVRLLIASNSWCQLPN